MAELTQDLIWQEIEKNVFAVLGMVTADGEARTVGIVYVVHDRTLYIGSQKDTWKVKHIAANPHVSMTVAIPKSVPLMPWFKIPAATVTFSGTAEVLGADAVGDAVIAKLFRGMKNVEELKRDFAVIAVKPTGHFVTYGVGVSLMEMRDPAKARARVPVA
jgi:nitroimidazol reductase NimA-like FMN-containing flavoprotein (pyridoxamine 5'-phosphate oxidase superfamily)